MIDKTSELEEELLTEIIKEIETTTKFENDGISILNYDNNKYFAEINDDTYSYNGFLDHKLARSYLGKYVYSNGDVYLGQWTANLKNGKGILVSSNSNNSVGEVISYIGTWIKGIRQNTGLIVWKKNESNFDIFIGEMENNKHKRGLYISKRRNTDKVNSYAYFGGFSLDGSKSERNCFYYDYHNKILFYGDIINDKAEKGYHLKYNEHSHDFDSIMHIVLSRSGEIEEITKDEAIDQERKELIYDRCDKFMSFLKVKNSYVKDILDYNMKCMNLVKKEFDINDEKKTLQIITNYISFLEKLEFFNEYNKY